MDPPWNETGGGRIRRGADRHYSLLKTKDIPGVVESCPLWGDVAEDAHVYIWSTINKLPDALWVGEQLGFRYITKITWTKTNPRRVIEIDGDRFHCIGKGGLGRYITGVTEDLLLFSRGRARVPDPKDRRPSALWAPRGEHSAKPDEQYDIVESISGGPYAELFARGEARPGWQTWGDEC